MDMEKLIMMQESLESLTTLEIIPYESIPMKEVNDPNDETLKKARVVDSYNRMAFSINKRLFSFAKKVLRTELPKVDTLEVEAPLYNYTKLVQGSMRL